MEENQKDARQRTDHIDLYLRGAFVSPLSRLSTILYILSFGFLLWYLILFIFPMFDVPLISFYGVLLVLAAIFFAWIIPGLPFIPLFLIPAAEFFLFGRAPFEMSWLTVSGTLVVAIYSIIHTQWAINQLRVHRGEVPLTLFAENPMAKKEVYESEIGEPTPGFRPLSFFSTTFGLLFLTAVLIAMFTDPGERWLPAEALLPFVSIVPIAFTLTAGLRLIYVQGDVTVAQAIKWVWLYFSLIIFGFASVYQSMFDPLSASACLNVPDYLSNDTRDQIVNSLYFSVVTFTTLGYGDIQPLGWCRIIAMSQALCGILFTPIFIVFLVGVVSKQNEP